MDGVDCFSPAPPSLLGAAGEKCGETTSGEDKMKSEFLTFRLRQCMGNSQVGKRVVYRTLNIRVRESELETDGQLEHPIV